MTDPGGGLHSTRDADSEGQEDKFLIWTQEPIREEGLETARVV